MAHATHTELGTVVSLWRYPVKSMLGEELHTAQVQDHGLLGDRAYAILDSADGKAATAKNPHHPTPTPAGIPDRSHWVTGADSHPGRG
jgi:uncharacterized protein YcbX